MVPENKVLLSAKELKEVTGFSIPRAYELMHDKTMPVVKIGGRLFMHREKFMEWLAEQATPQAEKEEHESKGNSAFSPD